MYLVAPVKEREKTVKISTDFVVGGHRFSMEYDMVNTLGADGLVDQGMVLDLVQEAITSAKIVADTLMKTDGVQTAAPTVEPTPSSREAAEPPSAQITGDGGVLEVSRVVVEGTLDNPIVRMFSPNEKLKFPVMTCPYSVLLRVLQSSHPGVPDNVFEKFGKCGSVHTVDWSIYWIPSPKNPRYKDLSKVQVNRKV